MLLKERIIFSNSFNEAEFLRTLSKNNINTFGVRVLNDKELCSYILMKNGIKMSGSFITDKEETFIYYSFLKGVLDDSKNIKDAINSFRDCIDSDVTIEMEKFLSDDFDEKKSIIMKVYSLYKDYKKTNNLYDKHDMINFIIENKLKVSNVDIEIFKEFRLTYIMNKLITNVFDNIEEVSIFKYFKEYDNNINLIKAFGKKNEIDYIFNKINDENLKLDECQIVLIDTKDLPEVLTYIKKLSIPYTSSFGIPIIDTFPGKLLKSLIDLKNMNYGVDGYKKLFNNNCFNTEIIKEQLNNDSRKYNEFIKNLGWLRLRFFEDVEISNVYLDKDNNLDYTMFNALNSFKEDLNKGVLEFIYKYVNAETKDSIIAFDRMEELLELKSKYSLEIDDLTLLETLLPIATGGIVSSESKIHICGLDKAFSSLRKYNFIVGLDDGYPGNPKENYLIYDIEYNKTKSNIYVSTNEIKYKENLLKSFIKVCQNAYLIYPYYDILSLKDKNPSSIVYDEIIYDRNYNPTNIIEYGFKDSNITENINVIKSKINNEIGIDILKFDYKDVKIDSKLLFNKSFNPSSIRGFFDNKLAFVLSTILGVSIDDSDDVYTVMPSNEKGNIIHKIMEGFQKDMIDRTSFINDAIEKYDNYLLKKPAVIESQKEIDKNRFVSDVENIYDMDPNNRFIASEVAMSGSIGKVKLYGKFDRLEKTRDNKYIIVDYKTGSSMNHKSNDVISCIQGLIYAYLVELNGIKGENIKVSRVEFRYPRLNQVAYIEYNEDTKLDMINAIKELEDAIINNDFSCTKDLTEYSFIDKYKVLLSLFEEVRK